MGKRVTLILPLPFVFPLIYAATEKSALEALNLRRDKIYAFANLFQIPRNIIELLEVILQRANFFVLTFICG